MSSLHYEATYSNTHFPELSVLSDCIGVVIQFKVSQLRNSHMVWCGVSQLGNSHMVWCGVSQLGNSHMV